METPAKPDRYSEVEWENLKDIAEPDELIPLGSFVDYMRSVLAHIIAYSNTRGVDAPPIVQYLVTQSDKQLQTMQSSLKSTYLEMQLWCGDMKSDIFERSIVPKD